MMSVQLNESLSHPLVLLLVGALISSVLVPSITRRWQDHLRELEFKSELVTEMVEKSTQFLTAVQIAHVASEPHGVNDAYRQWQIDSAVILSRLRTHYPQQDVADGWSEFSFLAVDLYALRGFEADEKRSRMSTLLADVGANTYGKGPEAKGLQERLITRYGVDQFNRDWLTIYGGLLAMRDDIVRDVLDERPKV